MPRVVVLGTGTGVGKTFVACAVARALRQRMPGVPVAAVKPIETGVIADGAADASRLTAATWGVPPPHEHPLYAFPAALSPYRAAKLEKTEVELGRVLDWLQRYEQILPYNTWRVIETAGGVFSPLGQGLTNLDLARACEPAIWLLVGADALGVLHDLTATLSAMRQLARAPDLIVLSAARVDESTGSNLSDARELGIASPVAALAPGDERGASAIVDALLAHA